MNAKWLDSGWGGEVAQCGAPDSHSFANIVEDRREREVLEQNCVVGTSATIPSYMHFTRDLFAANEIKRER